MNNKWIQNNILSEKDFYPPSDDRFLQTYIEEQYDGEYVEHTGYIFDLSESEDYYEN